MSTRFLRLVAGGSTAVLLACGLTGCAGDKVEDQTFVQVQQAAQWLADHECDRSGGQKGDAGYGGEGMAQIAQITFVCDNGKSFDIRLQKDGTFRVTALKA